MPPIDTNPVLVGCLFQQIPSVSRQSSTAPGGSGRRTLIGPIGLMGQFGHQASLPNQDGGGCALMLSAWSTWSLAAVPALAKVPFSLSVHCSGCTCAAGATALDGHRCWPATRPLRPRVPFVVVQPILGLPSRGRARGVATLAQLKTRQRGSTDNAYPKKKKVSGQAPKKKLQRERLRTKFCWGQITCTIDMVKGPCFKYRYSNPL